MTLYSFVYLSQALAMQASDMHVFILVILAHHYILLLTIDLQHNNERRDIAAMC